MNDVNSWLASMLPPPLPDISNTCNVLCRQLTLDVLGGKASYDYACLV